MNFKTPTVNHSNYESSLDPLVLAQQGERNASEALLTIESASPVNMTLFAAGQAVLISDIMFGMTIREYNQLIAPAGNAALPGLAKYAAAQATELGLAQSLNGIPAHDAPILAMLVSDVTTGIQLNQNNTEAVSFGPTFDRRVEFPAVYAVYGDLLTRGIDRLLLVATLHCYNTSQSLWRMMCD